MANASYCIEWSYLGELPEVAGIPYKRDEANCDFLIRFLDVPPGNGHCAFLCVNVITPARAAELGVGPNGRRGYLVADAMTREDFCRRVTEDVRRAFDQLPRPQALAQLDETYIWRDQDYRDEFLDDVPRVEDLAALIEEAFAGVTRGEGVTLHEAIAEGDYAAPDAVAAARALDQDSDWHDVPRDVLAAHSELFSYLDAAGHRYYLPAVMLFSLDAAARNRSETPLSAYWSLLPRLDVRDFGKGKGKTFDVEAFIASRAFTDAQVRAIYRFLCFMACEAGEGVDEEELPAMRKWRESARRRTRE